MKFDSLPKEVRWAVEAAQDKQALDISVLDLSGTGAFADYFLVCSGSSAPQLQAITRGIEEKLDKSGRSVQHREGRGSADWMLLDYGFFVVHVFSEGARQYYDLERLWRTTERIEIPNVPGNAVPPHHRAAESEGNATQR
jgi:ribosome-associated protein